MANENTREYGNDSQCAICGGIGHITSLHGLTTPPEQTDFDGLNDGRPTLPQWRAGCYCTDGTCDFCAANLYAAIMEDKMAQLQEALAKVAAAADRDDNLESTVESFVERFVGEREFLSEREARDIFVTSDDALTQRDLDDAVEDCLQKNDFDPDDYVQTSDLETEISDALENAELVKDAAAGATEAAMSRVDRLTKDFVARTAFEERVALMEKRLVDAENMVEAHTNFLSGLTFRQRVRLLFCGAL